MENCCGLCTDDAKAMAGKNIGSISFFQAANWDNITFTRSLFIGRPSQQKNQHQT